MIKYIIRRLIQAVPTFFGITVISYLLVFLSPGSVIDRLLFGPNTRPEQRELLAAQLGISDPFPVQYLRWLLGDDWMRWDSDGDGISDQAVIIPLDVDGDGEPEPPGRGRGILRGDFGQSFLKRQPASTIITERMPATLELGVTALVLSLCVGLPVGVISAVQRGKLVDNLSRVMAVMFNAVPAFWLGLILILIFGSTLGWLPMGSRCKPSLTGVCPPLPERLEFLIMPAFVLATTNIAIFSRFMRTSMLEVMGQDFVRTAQSTGLAPRAVYVRHAMRNALIPIATLIGPIITGLWAGAVVIEQIFSWPGVGQAAVKAIIDKDYPVIMAAVIFTSVGTIIGFLISDILYAVIDPRIRLQ
ncbi:MAG: ABC transporter permease [Anaerolineae bacterium]|nr:ABC transporter permease [Anaerolineae bacterium]